MSARTLMSVEEFARLDCGETEDYELVEGELIPLPSGTPLHAAIRGALESLLRNYFSQNGIGHVLAGVDCQLSQDSVRRPDLSILLGDRFKTIERKKIPVPFAPEIAVEILSPTEIAINVHRKTLQYLAAGCAEVWQLDAENGEIFVQTDSGIRLLRDGDKLESALLPGFSVSVAELLSGS